MHGDINLQSDISIHSFVGALETSSYYNFLHCFYWSPVQDFNGFILDANWEWKWQILTFFGMHGMDVFFDAVTKQDGFFYAFCWLMKTSCVPHRYDWVW